MSSELAVCLGTTVLKRGERDNHVDGIAVFSRSLKNAIEDTCPNVTVLSHEFPFFLERRHGAAQKAGQSYPVITAMSLIVGHRHYTERVLGVRADLFHALDHRIPRLDIPVVATVHDAVPLIQRAWVTPHLRSAKNYVFRKTVRWADKVVAASEFAADEIARAFEVSRNRISVVHHGVDSRFSDRSDQEKRCSVLRRHKLRPNFFFVVATLQPRKNLSRLIAAFRKLPAAVRKEHPLVVAGRYGWLSEDVVAALVKLREAGEGKWLGAVADADLPALMQSALAFVFPSLYEGFGLPVLEAFAAGVPVLTSRGSALQEIAGAAALLVDPHNDDEITEGLLALISDKSLREALVKRGMRRATSFSWQKAAREMEMIYRSLA